MATSKILKLEIEGQKRIRIAILVRICGSLLPIVSTKDYLMQSVNISTITVRIVAGVFIAI